MRLPFTYKIQDLLIRNNFEELEARRLATPVTALPKQPVDGQQIQYLFSAGPPRVLWTLEWHAAQGKWEFVGGNPYQAQATDTVTINSASYSTIGIKNPQILLPKGRYLLRYGTTYFTSSTVTANTFGQVDTAAPGADPAPESLRFRTSASATDFGCNVSSERITGEFTNDATFGFWFRNADAASGASTSSIGRWLEAVPYYLLP